MDRTKDWELYEAGKRYNNSLTPNYYDTVNANLAFFNGDQWRNITAENMPKPVFNIIKRVIQFFVASLTSADTKIQFEPLLYTDDNPTPQMVQEADAAEIANAMVDNLFEKFEMSFKIRDALFDAAITGDACAHFIFNKNKRPYGAAYTDVTGEIEMELVDGTNVYFGNANNPDVEKQPYIIISGRDMVENLKEEAKQYKSKEVEQIESDRNYESQAGDAGEIEVETDEYGKAFYIIVYRRDKKTGRIKASKSVENAYIYKDIDTGLDLYPVAWLNWERQKNTYHGRAICTGLLPNQIFINRMFAMVMYHLMMTAFPKAVYNSAVIPEWTNEIAQAIGVTLDPSQNIGNVATYLKPGEMSQQIIQCIELAMQYTKETMGISDAALGQIDPKNTSAIIAVQKSSIVPLQNPKANLYRWIENIGRILLDMMGTYYGVRPIVIQKNGIKQLATFDFSVLKNMWFNIRADVGEASYWSEIAAVQTLDNLLSSGYLDIIDYLERIPGEYIPRKQELINKLEERMQQDQDKQLLYEQMARFVETLSPDVQEKIKSLPAEQMEATVKQMMIQSQQVV